MLAARGDTTQFRHRQVRWEGLITFSKQICFCFLTEKVDAIAPYLLCINQLYISALKSERLPLFVVYIDTIYGIHLKEQIQIVSQN